MQVNSSGVMPIIFSTSSLALPGTLARFTGLSALKNAALALNPGGKIQNFSVCNSFVEVEEHGKLHKLCSFGLSIFWVSRRRISF